MRYGVGARVEAEEKVREWERRCGGWQKACIPPSSTSPAFLLFNLSFVHVPPLMPLAISQSGEGFSMWLAFSFIFFQASAGHYEDAAGP